MKLAPDAIENGVFGARTRCTGVGFAPSEDQLKEAREVIRAALTETPGEWHPRAITLFAEVVTIGAVARAHYKEPALKPSEVANFASVVAGILNSFTHK